MPSKVRGVAEEQVETPGAPGPDWRTALLMMACFVMAQADKQVMGLLAIPVQQAFSLTNTQLGFLQGGAFAIAFALGGLPIAQALDGGHRIRIAAACVAAWSLATIMCGLATSFAMLVAFRAATAFAEAGLPPAAFSIFSQSDRTAQAARLTGTFMLAPFIGGGGILLFGGVLLQLGQSGFGDLEGWRLVLMAVGLPGLGLAAALLLWGYEPPRGDRTAIGIMARKTTPSSYRQVASTIFVQNTFLRYYYLGLASFYLFAAALIGWYPALLSRELGLSTSAAGAHAGIIYLAAGTAGTVAITARSGLSPNITDLSLVKFYVAALLALLPISIALPLMTSLPLSLGLYGIYAFLSAAVMASMALPIQMNLPNDMQARAVAIFSLLMSAMAGSLGPFVVGLLTDALPLKLSQALSLVAGTSAILAAIFLNKARRTHPQE